MWTWVKRVTKNIYFVSSCRRSQNKYNRLIPKCLFIFDYQCYLLNLWHMWYLVWFKIEFDGKNYKSQKDWTEYDASAKLFGLVQILKSWKRESTIRILDRTSKMLCSIATTNQKWAVSQCQIIEFPGIPSRKVECWKYEE